MVGRRRVARIFALMDGNSSTATREKHHLQPGEPRTEPPRENEEILDSYLLTRGDHGEAPWERYAEHKRLRSPPPLSSMVWDPIDPKLAAKLNFERVLAWATTRAVRWASCLEQLSQKYEPVVQEPPAKKRCQYAAAL